MFKFETFIQLACWICFSVHFGLIARDFFIKEVTSTTTNTETLTLQSFPILVKICIDPAFTEENFGYNNPQEFISGDMRKNISKTSKGKILYTFDRNR